MEEKKLVSKRYWESRNYREKNRDKVNALKREYYQRHKERIKKRRKVYLKEYTKNNRDKENARHKKWRNGNGKEKRRAGHVKYAMKHREQLNDKHKRRGHLLKIEVLGHYSKGKPKCACCRESHLEFLCMDHINNDGNKHRKEIGLISIVRWLKTNGYPEGFQVLCFNCNWAKARGGCPHKLDKVLVPSSIVK